MKRQWLLAIMAGLWTLAVPAMPARAQSSELPPVIDCRAASELAEQAEGLPPGLLFAIGKIETGRPNPATGRVEPFPWATNQAGVGHYFGSAQEAIAWTSSTLTHGFNSIDVGCFQINLMYHPTAFTTLEEAFDPIANARYAAHFLMSLYRRAGGWPLAVAQYHSADPALGLPYGDKVYSAWNGTWPGDAAQAGPVRTTVAPRVTNLVDPFVIRISEQAAGIQVILPSWATATPRASAAAPLRIASAAMPMVVTAAGIDAGGHGTIRGGSRLPRVYRP